MFTVLVGAARAQAASGVTSRGGADGFQRGGPGVAESFGTRLLGTLRLSLA